MPRLTVMNRVTYLPMTDPATGSLNAIVETPKDSRMKFDYDEGLCLFKLGGLLPEGSTFPFNFGFIPSTRGEDGDPLDVLILMEEAAFTGCLLTVRLVGVIEAEQRDEDGKTLRNDRLIAVSTHSRQHADIESLKAASANLIAEIEHFFVSYNEMRGKRFKPLGNYGPKRAARLLAQGRRRYRGRTDKAAKK
jgi:inorganic pyrophosphatase